MRPLLIKSLVTCLLIFSPIIAFADSTSADTCDIPDAAPVQAKNELWQIKAFQKLTNIPIGEHSFIMLQRCPNNFESLVTAKVIHSYGRDSDDGETYALLLPNLTISIEKTTPQKKSTTVSYILYDQFADVRKKNPSLKRATISATLYCKRKLNKKMHTLEPAKKLP